MQERAAMLAKPGGQGTSAVPAEKGGWGIVRERRLVHRGAQVRPVVPKFRQGTDGEKMFQRISVAQAGRQVQGAWRSRRGAVRGACASGGPRGTWTNHKRVSPCVRAYSKWLFYVPHHGDAVRTLLGARRRCVQAPGADVQ